MHDYMICIDENGSPYLAHAWFSNKKGSQKKDHKWYARENLNGKWRYWYDPESYKNWVSGAVNKAKSTVDNVVNKSGIRQRKELSDAKKDNGLLSGLKQKRAQSEYDKTVLGRAEKMAVDSLSKAKEAARPLDRKKKSVLNNIHEKFKDVTLDAIGSVIDKDGAKARKNLEYFDNDMSGFTKAVYGLFGARAVNEIAYNSSKLKKIENFLDSPIAALHDAKYQQYAWKAGTTGFDKPKEIMSNAKKAWDERVKRDEAQAKSMKRRGVSPQTLLR